MSRIEKSRNDIEKGIQGTKDQSEKLQRKLDQDVKDKESIKQVADRLKKRGTSEALRNIAKKGEQAAEKIDKQTEKDHKELDQTAHTQAKDRESELKERAEAAQQDGADLKRASGDVKQTEAKSFMNEAAGDAKQDEDYLKKAKSKQLEIRNKSEREAHEKEKKVKSARPRFEH